jgi:predicted O-methyltransferase YrrM
VGKAMILNWKQYLNDVDDSHTMTTDKKHIAMLCDIVENKEYSILELGSYLGISTAALALASPKSSIIAVDLCDHIPNSYRINYWDNLGIKNIKAVQQYAQAFLINTNSNFDFIFHDAVHGNRAINEYLLCSEKTKILAIHDFEHLSVEYQNKISGLFSNTIIDTDTKNRQLFIGLKE